MIGWTWVMEALLASAALMLAVLLVRRPVRRAFGPNIAYALWALPALRLVLPPLPASWRAVTVQPVLRATEQVSVLLVEPVAGPVAPVAAPLAAAAPVAASAPDLWSVVLAQLVPALALLWIVGAVAFVAWHALAHRRFCARMLAGAWASDTVDGIHVIQTAAATGPLAFGIWQRYVALPSDVAERYDADERALALAHELGHHARGDLIANWIALAVLAVHWFNPVAWRAFRAFRADQEIANDARVLAGLSPMRRHAYACAIVKTAHPAVFGAPVSTACHLNTIDDLKGRLRMLTTKRVSRLRLLSGAATISLMIAAGLGLTASGTAAVAAARVGVEHATGVDLGGSAQEAPPAPPVSPVASADLPAPPPPPAIAAPAVDHAAGPHTVRKIMVTRNGKTTIYEHGDIDAHLAAHDRVEALPLDPHGSRMIIMNPDDPNGRIEVQDIPAISSANCGIGTGTPASMVVNSGKGPKRKIVICTDRIHKVVADSTAVAVSGKEIERNAYRSALAGLRKARAEMVARQAQSGGHSAEALPALDSAIAEVQADLAHAESGVE